MEGHPEPAAGNSASTDRTTAWEANPTSLPPPAITIPTPTPRPPRTRLPHLSRPLPPRALKVLVLPPNQNPIQVRRHLRQPRVRRRLVRRWHPHDRSIPGSRGESDFKGAGESESLVGTAGYEAEEEGGDGGGLDA